MQLTDNTETEVVSDEAPVKEQAPGENAVEVEPVAPDYAGDILDELGGGDAQGDIVEPIETEITSEEAQAAAMMTAAVATGGIATGIEFFLNPAKVSDQQRSEFAEVLAPVLAESNGEMTDWLVRLLADWKEELLLARKTVSNRCAIRDQYKTEKAKQITLPDDVPGPGEKPRVRVPAEETAQAAA